MTFQLASAALRRALPAPVVLASSLLLLAGLLLRVRAH
jgi:hypothetical protein